MDTPHCSRPPSERRMSPIEILNLGRRLAGKFLVHIHSRSVAIAHLHPEQQADTGDENRAARCQIQTVANGKVGAVKRQETPSGNEASNVAEHDDGTNGRGSCRVGDYVGRCLGVAESSKGESTGRDEKGCCVANH